MSSGGGGGACGGVAAQGGGAAVRERACRCAARAAAAAARLCAAEAHGWHALESCGLALEGGMLEPRKVHVVRAMNEGSGCRKENGCRPKAHVVSKRCAFSGDIQVTLPSGLFCAHVGICLINA